MNIYEQAIMESKIEAAENRIRSKHNEMESTKIFGKKNYFMYESQRFLDMINLIRKDLGNGK